MDSKEKNLTQRLGLSRRNFIKLAVGGALGTVLSPLPWKVTDDIAIWTQNLPWVPVPPSGKFSYAVSLCKLCPGGCGIKVRKVDDRAVKIEGRTDYPVNPGGICPLGMGGLQLLYNENIRFAGPMKRVGVRGSSEFQAISWDEALDTIATRFGALVESGQAERILPYSYYGTMGVLSSSSMDRRFFNRLGAARLQRTICSSAGKAGYLFTMRQNMGTDPEAVIDSKLIIVWGSNPLNSNLHQWPFIAEAKKRGARLIVIDPHRTRTAELADEFVQLQPGTDGALALALMNVIITENLFDRGYIETHTVGFAELTQRAMDYSPEKVSVITGIEPEAIRRLAREYATTRPAFIRIGMGLQRHSNGGMTVRAISCLPALIGSWQEVGGGALYSNGGCFPFELAYFRFPAGRSYFFNRYRLYHPGEFRDYGYFRYSPRFCDGNYRQCGHRHRDRLHHPLYYQVYPRTKKTSPGCIASV
jgi:anaerobic selenocysteine-containing dehydrogenase